MKDALTSLGGGGEMGERIRAFDWAKTPVGPIADWPQSLKTAVRMMLGSRYPMFIWWGPAHTNFYNDAYVPVLGKRHPDALGRSAPSVWSDIWDTVGPQAQMVLAEGRATWNEELLLVMERNAFTEETYFTFSYSPVPDDSGGVGGVFCACTEDTTRVLGQRRLRTLRTLAEQAALATTAEGACEAAAATLAANPQDLPFALVYLLESDGQRARLVGASGLAPGAAASPPQVALDDSQAPWPFAAVAESGAPIRVDPLPDALGPLPGGPWPEPPTRAQVLPLAAPGQTRLAGFVVAGLSPRLAFDDDYQAFLDLVAGHVATAVVNARAHEEERRRTEALAELDRAKTTFFSNVSHEFRTPLSLVLGPVEDVLRRDDALSSDARASLEMASRNGLRLLRLVNSLLDFSRIEAGRVRAVYEPTDLASVTSDLASVFRAACERAGLALAVDCPPLPEPVFVDREMWEKVVLNLLSNAFKFTFEGTISVSLRRDDGDALLCVRDTGIGIPAAEMPRLFERFHRVENARGRTQEGSGIGLALVQELVKLHGGSIAAESGVGEGTSFFVRIPFGSAHLPANQIGGSRTLASTATGAGAYVEEALRWLPDLPDERNAELLHESTPLRGPDAPAPPDADARPPRILVVDDNADLRQYLARLLSDRYRVDTAEDGEAALARIRAAHPDLVVSDVMMPRLDGYGLLRALRADPTTSSLPVLLLSARAGEPNRVEALSTGANAYLEKPFSARELLAQVAAQLELARVRRESQDALREGERQLRLALRGANAGVCSLDVSNGETWWSEEFAALYGFDADTPHTYQRWLASVHPDDRPQVESASVENLSSSAQSYRLEFRILHPVRGVRWILSLGQIHRDTSGRAVRVNGINIDVTERKEIDATLRRSEERFRSVFENVPTGIAITDWQGRFEQCNPAYSALVGYSEEELRELVFRTLIHPDDLEENLRQLRLLQSGKQPYFEIENRYVRKGGEVVWVRKLLSVLRDEEGSPAHILALVTDVTATREAGEALRESESFYRQTLESIPGMTFTNTPDGACDYVSDQWVEFTGVPAEQHEGDGWLQFVHPEDRQRTLDAWRAAVVEGGEYDLEYRLRRHDGEYEWFKVRARAIRGTSGEIVRWFGTAVNVDDLKRAEAALCESEARFRALANNISQLAWMADEKGWIFWYNARWYEFTGTTLEEMEGWGWRKVHHPDHVDRVVEGIQHAWDTGEPWEDLFPLRSRDGSWRWFLSRAQPIRDEHGNVVRWFGTNTDVTEQRAAEQELRRADQRKDEFLATLAHELRNPLAPLRSGLELMKITPHDAQAVEQARSMMERQLRQMVRLIDDLLDVSRISRGKVELRKERVELTTVVRAALETVQPLIEEAGREIAIELPQEPLLVDADLTRLAQVFSNLIGNALKFTGPGGHVWITVAREAGEAVVRVRDDGVGIPPERLDEAFEMFTQLHRSSERAAGGLGIGLSLAKRLVEMHGGHIEARSEGRGMGSEFCVCLPAATASAPVEEPVVDTTCNAGRRRILVVDDNRDAALSLAMLLRLAGNEIRTAHDGFEALESAEAFHPDVVLLDIGMPRLDGYETARRMREQPWGRSAVLVALTGWGAEGDRRRSHEAGFDFHLVKPVERATLENLLAGLAERG